jgi:hypothetical protein
MQDGDLLAHLHHCTISTIRTIVQQPLLASQMYLSRIWVGIGQMLECWQRGSGKTVFVK